MQIGKDVLGIPKNNPSTIRLFGGGAMGSTNTNIPRFTKVLEYTGGAMSYTDSPLFGMSIKILESGVYAISMTWLDGTSSGSFGITKNSSELSTSIGSISNTSTILAYASYPSSGVYDSCSTIVPLNAGDVIRGHTETTTNNITGSQMFVITRLV